MAMFWLNTVWPWADHATVKGLSSLKGFDRLSLPSKDSFNLGSHVQAVCLLITAVHFPAFSAPSTNLLLPLPKFILNAGAVHEFFPSTLTPSLLPLATSLGSPLRRGGRMRRSPLYRQLDSTLCSSLFSSFPPFSLLFLQITCMPHWISNTNIHILSSNHSAAF